MAAAMPYLMMAGTALSAASSVQQANYADDLGEFNQQVASGNAALVEEAAIEDKRRAFEQGAAEEKGFRRSASASLSTSIMNVAKGGVTLAGSPLMVLNDVATNMELEARGIQEKYQTDIADIGYNAYINARDLKLSGANSAATGAAQKTAGYAAGAGTLLKGAGSAYSAYSSKPAKISKTSSYIPITSYGGASHRADGRH